MGDEEELKELRAYKVGYDLGWYRCAELVDGELQKLVDAMKLSPTFRQIEREAAEAKGKRPLLYATILRLIAELGELRREHTPTLLLERKAINELGEKISQLPPEVFEGDNLKNIDFIAKNKKIGE